MFARELAIREGDSTVLIEIATAIGQRAATSATGVCLAFDPQVNVPKRGLHVDLSTPRHVQIAWVES